MMRHARQKPPGWLPEACLTALAGDEALARALNDILAASPFLARLIRAEPDQLCAFADQGPDRVVEDIIAGIARLRANEALSMAEAMTALREARGRLALTVALADLTGRWRLEQVMGALSRFAEAAVDLATLLAVRPLVARGHLRPRPLSAAEAPETPLDRRCGLVVIAMGKLGGGELNYSSDIDLVLFFDEQAVRYDGPEDMLTAYIKVARTLVRLLQERTSDGYVFRVDLRLRPDPGATPIVLSMGAAEVYYQSMALAWERAAYIKARAVAGDILVGEAFLKRMGPFMWRRHLDYTAMRDIHMIKAEIHDHHGHDDPEEAGYNVKLGRGGIREIEFFVQIQQLIAGGREPRLRARPTLAMLGVLADLSMIPRRQAEALAEAYRFLRMVEHRLQMVDDAQTHSLPGGARALKELARLCGFASAAALKAAVRKRTALVSKAYAALLPARADDPVTALPREPESLARALKARGLADPAPLVEMLERWRHGRYRAVRAERARDIVERLLPTMLDAAGETQEPLIPLARFDELLSRLPAGVQLLSVFEANPALLKLVFRILVSAPRLGESLAREPGQLDVLLDPNLLEALPDAYGLAGELEQRLAQAETLEACLDEVRRWRGERTLQLAVQLLEAGGRGTRAAAAITTLADVAVEAIRQRVEEAFAQVHGRIAGGDLAVLALGRYGGRQLQPGSDLDLVFLFRGALGSESDGERPLTATTYYNRLAQRLVTALSAPTAAGVLYEVDTRLRPSGPQGLLAVTLPSFTAYQRDEAWTWEHMALTRWRIVSASPGFAQEIGEAVNGLLARPREADTLKADVLRMRADMRQHNPGDAPLDLKSAPGGLIDAEFILQYLQLRTVPLHPQVIAGTLEASAIALAGAGALTPAQSRHWRAAYATLSQVQLLLRLTDPDARGPDQLTDGVSSAISRALGADGIADVMAMIAQARARIGELWTAIFE